MKQFILAVIVLIGWTIAFTPIEANALTISPVRFEISGDPGQTLIGEITLFNESEIAETFYSSFESFEARGEGGEPHFVPTQKGLPTWMKTESTITLEPGETKIVPFSIEIPEDADPGGHFAVIFWSNVPPVEAEEQMIVATRIGILVLLRVSGEIREGGGILEFGAENRIYTHLPISLFYRLANDGNNWLRPEGEVKISNIIGLQAAVLNANPVQGNILPGSIRRFDVEWEARNEITEGGFLATARHQWQNFALGPYKATLALRNGISAPETETTKSFKSSFWFFIIPWQLLIIIIIVLMILGFFGTKGLKKYNRWIIEKATKDKQ